MDYQATNEALRTHFNAQWSATPIAYRNGPQIENPPGTPWTPDPEVDAWVEISILNTFSTLPTVGGRERRMQGRVITEIYTPLKQGDGRARNYADLISELWDTAHVNGLTGEIQLWAPEFVAGGADQAVPFWRETVSTTYWTWEP